MSKVLLSFLITLTFLNATEIKNLINKKNCNHIIDKDVHTIWYDYFYKGAKYVAYTLNADLLNKGNIKERGAFYTESNIPHKYRSNSSDYTNSGYDRGHIANDASFDYDEKAMRKTYSMSNIIPQSQLVNRNTWIKVERYERLVASKLGYVSVLNGVYM